MKIEKIAKEKTLAENNKKQKKKEKKKGKKKQTKTRKQFEFSSIGDLVAFLDVFASGVVE